MNYGPSLIVKAEAELELRRRRRERQEDLPLDWQTRIRTLFKDYFWHPFSPPHEELWSWANDITPDSNPRPFVAIWPRGRGKSTNAEAIVADVAVRRVRTYCMYVSGTQDQADKHVGTIARMLESEVVARFDADVARPRIGKNGAREWRRRLMTTASGLSVEAIGLNKAVRGQKVNWARPDLIIFDDVDELHDTALTLDKKEGVITGSVLPAGASGVAVLFVQNLIHAESIASKLARPASEPDSATFLMDRVVSGPYPAVEDLEYEAREEGDAIRWTIVGGRSLWTGFSLEVCEDEINLYGPRAFEVESQHEVDADSEDALLTEEDFKQTRVMSHPDLAEIVVGVDPATGSGKCGIVTVGKARLNGDWHGFTLRDDTIDSRSTQAWAKRALAAYFWSEADRIVYETNQGGNMVEDTMKGTKLTDEDLQLEDATGEVLVDGSLIKYEGVHASRGKVARAQPVGVLFEEGRAHHVGVFSVLEKQWRTYKPGEPSPDRLDAEVWAYYALGLTAGPGFKQMKVSGLYGSRQKGRGRR